MTFHHSAIFLISLACCPLAWATESEPRKSAPLPPGQRAASLVDKMTIDEQLHLLSSATGSSLLDLGDKLPPEFDRSKLKPKPEGAIGSAGFVAAIPRLGIPALQESDASLGVGNFSFLRPGDEATALPSLLSQASTFDRELAGAGGRLIGEEAHAKGFNVQLAGGVNLARDPRNGRNFEYPGEDPLLSGTIAGAQIAGIQSRNVVSTVKHYALNGMETGRTVHDARIDEGALRESDLLAFQIAIEEGSQGSVMCAYNKVNGIYACENPFLLNQVLKKEWGFAGWVMSDWGALHSLEGSVLAGMDQQSPQGEYPDYFAGLKDALAKGTIGADRIRDMAHRILTALYAAGAMDNPARPGGTIDIEGHAAIAEALAASGIVLLKNDGTLPIATTAARIAIIGGNADRGVLSGGGSSQVVPYGGRFRDERGATGLAALLSPSYGKSSPLKALQSLRPGARIVYDDGSDAKRAATVAAEADVVLVFAVKHEVESLDSPDLSLPYGQDALIARVAAANPRTVVVLETGNPVAMPWLDAVAGVLQAWYPGQRGGEAIAAVLDGKRAPSGRLPITFPASVEQLPRPLIPGFDPKNRLPFDLGGKPEPFDLVYNEGSDIGYRWYEKNAAKPLFPFGHGLTYTTFEYARPRKPRTKDGLSVEFKLKNTGTRAGTEVAQLYVAPPGRTHRLVGWAKVELRPGESRKVMITADPRLLASYNDEHGWGRAAGTYTYYVGRAAGVPEFNGSVELSAKAGQ